MYGWSSLSHALPSCISLSCCNRFNIDVPSASADVPALSSSCCLAAVRSRRNFLCAELMLSAATLSHHFLAFELFVMHDLTVFLALGSIACSVSASSCFLFLVRVLFALIIGASTGRFATFFTCSLRAAFFFLFGLPSS